MAAAVDEQVEMQLPLHGLGPWGSGQIDAAL
jgi:hypothetical protein